MASKADVQVIINGKVYTLSGYESEEYLQRVAAYLNNKIMEFDHVEDYRRFSPDMRSVLLQLNIADDYFKARNQTERLEKEIEERDREIYELKHDLISNQIKQESDEKKRKELESENKELLLNKAKLEATLEDALLGKVSNKKELENEKGRSGRH
ncbi:MAG: cell division protein ZapA [Lachnospiraceae bacterium]|nr:cell division protein ZapA [Lachnospiraceae bacterium]